MPNIGGWKRWGSQAHPNLRPAQQVGASQRAVVARKSSVERALFTARSADFQGHFPLAIADSSVTVIGPMA
ncbi:hypothetical protein GCM10009105_21850 [Dokdonella soli]|uniref:Uncharacterized protein n=1 Tax=Dokdonella soli TaxID=529810 RepID=A0ABN1IK41_9GAMM